MGHALGAVGAAELNRGAASCNAFFHGATVQIELAPENTLLGTVTSSRSDQKKSTDQEMGRTPGHRTDSLRRTTETSR